MDSYLDELTERFKRDPNKWNRQTLWGYMMLFDSQDPTIQDAKKVLDNEVQKLRNPNGLAA